MPTTEPTPPIRELPVELEQAVVNHHSAVLSYGRGSGAVDTVVATTNALYDAIRAALAERDTALRERCERLRTVGSAATSWRATKWTQTRVPYITGVEAALDQLHPGDLADDLRPQE